MIIGLDVSTSIIGIAFLSNSGSFVGSDHVDLRKVDGSIYVKARIAEQELATSVFNYLCDHLDEQNYVFIEDRLSGFSRGFTSQQTLLKLAAFNALISYVVMGYERRAQIALKVVHMHPSTVKAIMKKEGLLIAKGADKKIETLKFVEKKFGKGEGPQFLTHLNKNDKPQPYMFDRADALITAFAGHRRFVCS